jgi:hypothetical protein
METKLNVDLVPLETADQVDVLVAITARRGGLGDVVPDARAVSLVIRPAACVPGFTLWNDLPVTGRKNGVVVGLGDLRAGERRHLALAFEVPARAATIAEFELRWVDRGQRRRRCVRLPAAPIGRGTRGRRRSRT